jgi:4-hydroxythreonine-4-phosphate dehydrogenase
MIKLAITMGDPAGIGPEIILKTFQGGIPEPDCLPIVVGSCEVFGKTAHVLNIPMKCLKIAEIPAHPLQPGELWVLEPPDMPDLGNLEPGKVQKQAGLAAKKCIETAVRMILEKKMDALCTAPINKEAMHEGGFSFPGHTEFLAHLSNVREFAMLMCGGGIRVVLATIHIALRDIPETLTRETILEKLRLSNRFIPYFGIKSPRIGVCGLNPHAGEGGLFGDEETKIVTPAIEQAGREGISAQGPFPADTIFHRMLQGDFDVILAMYHDQGLIPIKTIAFHDGVNITMGLPFIRTSVDHGTGFDIVGKGIANPASLKAAIHHATLLCRNKNILGG